ncbi:MAG: lysophospholipid acyltransferase family protein [Polyangiales bacterium]
MLTIRSFVNLLFLGVWTAFMVSYAVTLGVLRGDPGLFRRLQRDWAKGLIRFWGVELEVHGREHMDETLSYVVMANHLSYVDIVVLFLALPIIPGFLAKRELTRVPFLGQALRSGGHVVIDRGQRTNAMQTINQAAEQVRGGKTVLIFPEGTRGDSDSIGTLKKGGFHLAKAAGVPILPVGVRGSRAIFPRGSLLIKPGKVEVHIGAPIPVEEVARRDAAEMVPLVRARLMELAAMPPRDADQASPQPA